MKFGTQGTVLLAAYFLLSNAVTATVLSETDLREQDMSDHLETTAVRTDRGQGWFFETFDGAYKEFLSYWEFAGYWANGQVCIFFLASADISFQRS